MFDPPEQIDHDSYVLDRPAFGNAVDYMRKGGYYLSNRVSWVCVNGALPSLV